MLRKWFGSVPSESCEPIELLIYYAKWKVLRWKSFSNLDTNKKQKQNRRVHCCTYTILSDAYLFSRMVEDDG